jgi:CubicO group peptidase (beta-lactamase class C family)
MGEVRATTAIAASCGVALAFAACFAPQAVAADAGCTPEAPRVTADVAAQALHRLATDAAGFGFSGAVLLARDGQVILRAAYGEARAATAQANAPGTLFEIGSLNKQFVAAAVLLLERDGKLALGDTLGKHFEGVPADKRAITLEQLLTHTAGLPAEFPVRGGGGLYHEAISREEAVERIFALPLDAAPGSGWSYSNVGYDLLVAIVERRSGQAIGDLLRDRLFRPAGMARTGVWPTHLPADAGGCLAIGHDEVGPREVDVRQLGASFLAGIVSSLDDLFRWQAALRGGRVLAPADVARLFAPRPEDYGYGWFVTETPYGRRISHGGDWHGFGSWLGWYERGGLTLVVLTNRNHQGLGGEHLIARLAPKLAFGEPPEMYPGERFDAPPASVRVADSLAAELVGDWVFPDGSIVAVSPEPFGGLQLTARGQAAADVLTDATAAERAQRAELTARVVRMVEEAVAGRSDELQTAVPEPPRLAGYRDAFASVLAECGGERGGVGSVERIGTVPAVYPHGELTTTLNLRCARGGEASFRVAWSDGRLVQIRGPVDLDLAATPLRAAPDGGLVAWSPLRHRAIRVHLRRGPTGTISGLALTGEEGVAAIAARRGAPATSPADSRR